MRGRKKTLGDPKIRFLYLEPWQVRALDEWARGFVDPFGIGRSEALRAVLDMAAGDIERGELRHREEEPRRRVKYGFNLDVRHRLAIELLELSGGFPDKSAAVRALLRVVADVAVAERRRAAEEAVASSGRPA